jgi:hypothetical protein
MKFTPERPAQTFFMMYWNVVTPIYIELSLLCLINVRKLKVYVSDLHDVETFFEMTNVEWVNIRIWFQVKYRLLRPLLEQNFLI